MPSWLRNFAANGYTGMGFFFVLSGFVLTVRYWDETIEFKEFVVARFARIYPAYAVAAVLSIPLFIHIKPGILAFHVFSNILLLQAWVPNLFQIGVNGGTWSLSVEAIFYVLFPAIFWLLRSRDIDAKHTFIALTVLWSISFLPGLCELISPMRNATIFYYSSPPYRLAEFSFGVLAATAWKRGILKSSGPWVVTTAVVFFLSSLAFNGMSKNNLTLLNITSLPFFSALIVFAAHERPSWLEWKPLVYLGEISYGFYLYQFTFMFSLSSLRDTGYHPILIFVGGFLVTVLMAAVSFRFLETPIRRYIRSRTFRSALRCSIEPKS